MIIRALQMNRRWLALGLFGLLPLMGGCGDSNTDKPAAPPAPQEAERDARQKAFGPSGQPTNKPGSPTGVAKPAEKAAPK